mgnify:CR=1 FL=1
MVRQMVYTSRLTVPLAKRAAFLSEISDTSLRKNPPRGITGGLLIASDLVVQFVEGPQDSISTLMATLRADERHAGIEVVHDAVSAERNMPEWAMAVRDVTDSPTSIQQIHTLVEDYRRSFRFRMNDLLLLMRSRLDLE